MNKEEKEAIDNLRIQVMNFNEKEDRILLNYIDKLQKGLDNQSKEVARLDKSIHKLNLEKIELLKENAELKEKIKEYEIGIVKE